MRPGRFARTVFVWTLVGAVFLSVLYWLFLTRAESAYEDAVLRYEREVGPADHTTYLRPAIEPESNQVSGFLDAVGQASGDGEPQGLGPPSAWDETDRRAVVAWLAAHRSELDGLRAAAGRSGCVWDDLPSQAVSWSQPAIRAVRLLRAQAYSAMDGGNWDETASALTTLEVLSSCLHGQPNLVGSLVAVVADRAWLEVIHELVARPDVGDGVLGDVEDRLRRRLAEPRVAEALAAEGAFALRFVQRPDLHPQETRVAGPIYPVFAKQVATEIANRWVELAAWSRRPLAELLTPPDATGENAADKARATTVIANILIPNMRDGAVKLRVVEELAGLALTAVRARRLGLELGAYRLPDGAAAFHLLPQDDGGVVVLASQLEDQLRSYYGIGEDEAPQGVEASLRLTAWRLPGLS